MSPEPTQEASKEDLDLENLHENVRIPAVSDSEDEDPQDSGYTLLSDNPNENELALNDEEDEEDEEEEWTIPSTSQQHINGSSVPDNSQVDIPQEVIEVWSSSCNQSNIDMDSDKICQVKSLMASFTLPNSVIPEWASTISEDQWKEQLMERISAIQKKKLS